ncbi:MAG: Wzt carbohydrate-binding domain-containing protein, partial [Dehalococcoidales bacterium]|nr:Wzt carbohydrate-binding domain-containing protein [Dehalococcoidales bacterium]
KPYTNIFVSSVIKSRLGYKVFMTNSMRLTGESVAVNRGESVFFSLELTVNLAPGVYDLGATVFDRVANKWIFFHNITSFVVEEDPRFDGIAFMNPKLLSLKVLSQ